MVRIASCRVLTGSGGKDAIARATVGIPGPIAITSLGRALACLATPGKRAPNFALAGLLEKDARTYAFAGRGVPSATPSRAGVFVNRDIRDLCAINVSKVRYFSNWPETLKFKALIE